MELIEKYNVVGMDTEFPGIVFRPDEMEMNHYNDPNLLNYTTIRMNVDNLKLIQIGITLCDEKGNLPDGISTWQFNFKFDLKKDMIREESINMLINAGIKFDDLSRKGIEHKAFAEYLISSGLLLNDEIKWVCFHGGFDFGYLIKMVIGESLPEEEKDFYNLLTTYFPIFYDVKTMIKDIDYFKALGLSKLASELFLKRVGTSHQAGSDSLLTLAVYFKLREQTLSDANESKYVNMLHGLKSNAEEYMNPNLWYNYLSSDYPFMMINNYQPNAMMRGNYYQDTQAQMSRFGYFSDCGIQKK